MKKYPLINWFILVFLSLSTITFAQSTKIIKLKDGSVLKGNVLELKDNIYTLETSNLGTVNIPESDILSIAAPEFENPSSGPISGTNEAQKEELKKKAEQVQGAILADPNLMTEVENLANDEEIKALLSDPKLIDDALSFDQDKLQQNKNVQDLMKNPKMQDLINKIQQQIPAQ
jgi:hypothetical protein